MKRAVRNAWVWLLGSVLVVAAPAAAIAESGPGSMEISAGYARCSSPIGVSDETMGGSVSLGMSYWHPISSIISLGGEFSMDDLGSAVTDTYDLVTSTTFHEEFSAHVLRLNPALRVNLGATMGPSFFAQGGAGWYRITWDYSVDNALIQAHSGDSSTELGFSVGAGLGYPVGHATRMTIVGTYHIVPANSLNNMDNTNNAQIRVGLGFEL